MDKNSLKFETVSNAELELIKERKGEPYQAGKLAGLALSGGGIRSATFSLGVLQSFAGRGLLEKFDYLSTVSGGGYIGSALSWYLSRTGLNENAGYNLSDKFPFGTNDPNGNTPLQDTTALKYLRNRGKYLTPGDGINLISAIGVVLRGMLVNLFVWSTLLTAIFVLLWMGSQWLIRMPPQDNFILDLFAGETVFHGFLVAGGCLVAAYLLYGLIYSFSTWVSSAGWLRLGSAFVISAGFSVYWYLNVALDGARYGVFMFSLLIDVILVFSMLSNVGKDLRFRYLLRRLVERYFYIIFVAAIVTLVIGAIPELGSMLNEKIAAAGGPAALVIGLAGATATFFGKSDSGSMIPFSVKAILSAVLVILGLLVMVNNVAYWLVLKSSLPGNDYLTWFWAMVAIALIISKLININYNSIHRFYRDRLMEAFMPDGATLAGVDENGSPADHKAPAKQANKALIKDLYCKQESKDDPTKCELNAPFHIINSNLALSGTHDQKYNTRGGDNFVITPLHCGGNATGWYGIDRLAGGEMTLATAMAISGAAADPHTGVGGEGVTRNWAVSFLMALFNIRLGFWINKPASTNFWQSVPDLINPGLKELFGGDYRPGDKFLHISDGGHFENLAVYELIRRRLDLIVVCDGGADAGFTFSDMQNLIRRVETDFGVRIDFSDEKPVMGIVPTRKFIFPVGQQYAERGYAIAKIMYPVLGNDGRPTGAVEKIGELVLLKTTMVGGMSIKTGGYKGQNPLFPDQSTADQFFDVTQFEAYRELGYKIGTCVINDMMQQPPAGFVEIPVFFNSQQAMAAQSQGNRTP